MLPKQDTKGGYKWAGPLECPLSKQKHSHIWFQDSKSIRVICPLWYEVENREITSQVAQWWRIFLPMQEMQETRVRSLSWEDPLEEEMATHSSTISWKIPWTEEPGGLQTMRSQRDTTEPLITLHRKQTEGLEALLLKTPDTIFL